MNPTTPTTLTTLTTLGLATWRLTQLWQQDTITQPLRNKLTHWLQHTQPDGTPHWITHNPDGTTQIDPQKQRPTQLQDLANWAQELHTCTRCLSVWIAATLTLAQHKRPHPTQLLTTALAAAAINNLLETTPPPTN